MKTLFKHQQVFLDKVKSGSYRNIISWEGGLGKTIAGCVWLKEIGTNKKNMVVCPKRVVKKWKTALKEWGAAADVFSKEEFKKKDKEEPWIEKYDNLVIDELDEFCSPLFLPGRSQLTESMYSFIKQWKPRVLGLSATPIRSAPHNLHTALALTGRFIDWKIWRNKFYNLEKRPYLPRPAWLPRSNWRELIQPVLKKVADIVLLSECVDELPPKIEEIVAVKRDPYTATEWEGSAAFFEEFRHEQKNKIPEIISIAKGFRKVLVVAYFKEQVEELKKALSKDRTTFAIHGGVNSKIQESVIEEANASDECFFIVQASMGAGFDANTFNCVVYASMSYAVRDYVQMGYRVRRIHDLRPVKFYYLLGGRCDRQIYKNIQLGKSFVPSEWSGNENE